MRTPGRLGGASPATAEKLCDPSPSSIPAQTPRTAPVPARVTEAGLAAMIVQNDHSEVAEENTAREPLALQT